MKEKIIVLLTEINPYEELDETMNLIDTHFLDSMGILILIDKIEEAFDVEIDIEKLNKNDRNLTQYYVSDYFGVMPDYSILDQSFEEYFFEGTGGLEWQKYCM